METAVIAVAATQNASRRPRRFRMRAIIRWSSP
jgi:hypothetical protein